MCVCVCLVYAAAFSWHLRRLVWRWQCCRRRIAACAEYFDFVNALCCGASVRALHSRAALAHCLTPTRATQPIALHAAWQRALRLRFAMHCARVLFPVQWAPDDDVAADDDVLVSISF